LARKWEVLLEKTAKIAAWLRGFVTRRVVLLDFRVMTEQWISDTPVIFFSQKGMPLLLIYYDRRDLVLNPR
jgi:hypothetical protein